VSPAINSPELLRKQTFIVPLPMPTKNVASTLHFNHPIQCFSHQSMLKSGTSWSLLFHTLWTNKPTTQFNNQTQPD
jgi:hypothetical protein